MDEHPLQFGYCLHCCRKTESSAVWVPQALGLKDRSHIHNSYLQPALVAGYIEMTLSEKPNSRLQKYRLTEKGFNILQLLKPE